MSIATVRPNETVDLGGATVTGAAGPHAATSDDSDASFVTVQDAPTRLGFAEPTIPGTAVLKEVRAIARNAKGFTNHPTLVLTPIPGGDGASQVITWTSPTTTTVGIFPPGEFNLADVELDVAQFSADPPLVYELYLDFVYVEQPVVTVTGPTGTLTEDNLPTITWERDTDFAGDIPKHYEVKLFDAGTFGDFSTVDPDASIPFSESGEVGPTTTVVTSYEVEDLLPNDTYRAYVRIAQVVNGELHWSEWDFETFTIDALAPGVPTIALVPQPACGRMRIDLDPRDQLCTNPEAATDLTGWTNVGLVTFERVTSLPTTGGLPAGVTTAFHAVGDGNNDRAEFSVAVENGKAYTFSAYVRLASLTATAIQLLVRDSANITVAIGALYSTVGGNFARLSVTVTATETATWKLRVQQTDAGAADWHFTAVLIEQAATLGEYFKQTTDAFQVQRSDDDGATWADIRTVDGGGRRDRSSNPLTTLLDWEAPNGSTAIYRARSIHSFAEGDTFSDWVEDEDSWESTDAWLKHPYDPTLNAIVNVYSQPGYDRPPRQGEFQPLGRSDVIVVSDTRAPERGEIVLETDTAAEQAALDALLDSLAPLLLQMPAEHHWPDRWVRFGDQGRARMVDKLEVEDALDTLRWVKVARPSGNLLAWPAVTCP